MAYYDDVPMEPRQQQSSLLKQVLEVINSKEMRSSSRLLICIVKALFRQQANPICLLSLISRLSALLFQAKLEEICQPV